MSKKITIDPVTRIEGHLKVEVSVQGGKVTDARCSGTMFRGLEQIAIGKDPRDVPYITERACGVCAGVHGWASCVAVEQAHGAKVPEMGRILRNLMIGALWLHDHVLHFYHLAGLDYIDPTAILQYRGNVPALVGVKEKVQALASAGDLHPLLPSYKPDEYCVRDPEVVTTIVHHYLQALDIQAKGRKASAIFAGKQPHHSTMVVGGVTQFATLEQIAQFTRIIGEVIEFIRNVYIPDVFALATRYLLPLETQSVGATAGHYLSYGGFPIGPEGKDLLFPAGVIMNNDFADMQPFSERDISEDVDYAWYKDALKPGHPSAAGTQVDLGKSKAYTFIKAPRYQGKPMEVGPMARMLIMRHPQFMDLITRYNIRRPGMVMRHAARAIDTLVMADAVEQWIGDLTKTLGKSGIYGTAGNAMIHDTSRWEPPAAGKGAGLIEAPRGALGHWIEVADRKVKQYQMVVPTTWNGSPVDSDGQPGPIEQALIGAPVPDVDNPLNVVRIIRSFDPCLACAIHVVHAKGRRSLFVPA